MSTFDPGRPEPDEYEPYFGQYIRRVPDGSIIDLLQAQRSATQTMLSPLTADQVAFRPKPDDWNMVQVVGHLADAERLFASRALWFARNETAPLPSFDPDVFMSAVDFEQLGWATVLADLDVVRAGTLALLRTFSEAAWLRRGVASNNLMSVRAMAYIIAGHELHHLADFRQRYGLAA